eukprot:Blabericola_migrator_1__2744@NODE_1782_length_3799_cov_120_045820_g1148_i0_p1_GENE_NODE_1782_length_3799_cov_120_045820_g1148_i0NODE_1782_length_3799_cov_120_045820_g1148_i0_p1_ORF_typecomplete_len504_score110_81Hexokinase_2/PF03727_16/5_3e50Hexokinase_1/PF00349_21/2_5e42ROK/PF00480_20/0_06_NODE_1782_length_3799_cov_120_045820_g1148_i016223133
MSYQIEKQNVVLETQEDRAQRYLKLFEFTPEMRSKMLEAFNADVHICKVHHRYENEAAGSMYFLDTCVGKPPTGKETGTYYAVDFGGTNIRAVRVKLNGDATVEKDALSKNILDIPTKDNLPKGLMDAKATATELFDNMAIIVKELMKKHNDLDKGQVFQVGFTFSFAMSQKDIDSAEAVTLSKGFLTGTDTLDPVVAKGTDLCLLLNSAFVRNEVPATVTAILNDTTGTLMSGAYLAGKYPEKPPTMIGLIVGTGVNACYADPDATQYGYIGSVINTEFGAFNAGLPRNIIDHEIDDADAMPGTQITEKMISGMYLPEACRRVILKVYQHKAPPMSWTHWSLSAEACLAMAYEEDPAHPIVKTVMKNQLQWEDLTDKDLTTIHKLCAAVLKRSANLLAVILAGLAKHTGRLQPALGGLTVAVDGSVFVKNKPFQDAVHQGLIDTLGYERASLVHFQIAEDGSGMGAAVTAALPHPRKRASFALSPAAVLEKRMHVGKLTAPK